MKILRVNLKEYSYNIYIKRGLLGEIPKLLIDIFKGKKIVIVTDQNVDSYYGKALEEILLGEGYIINKIILPPGESNKSFSVLEGLYEKLLEFNMTRSDLLIALGGGVIGDLTGFLASTYLRGIPYVQIPTSLLAQVDSSVGGKVAVDLKKGKNLVGSFYQPKAVYIDPNTLETLSEHYFRDGMAEVIKYGCILDKELFNLLEKLKSKEEILKHIEDIVYTCCNIKRKVVEEDEKDTNERMKLNFGHTIGHALEAFYNYETYSHGEAVAIGMIEITKIAEDKGLSPNGIKEKIEKLLAQNGLPIEMPVNMKELLKFIANDKKNMDNKLKVVILKEIGESSIVDTNLEFFDFMD